MIKRKFTFGKWYRPSVLDLDKPEKFSKEHVNDTRRAYLTWLAERRGVYAPTGAQFRPDGIFHDERIILAMPGYEGAGDWVEVEHLDESGEVVRAQRLPVEASAALPWSAAKVRDAVGNVAKAKSQPRKPKNISKAGSSEPMAIEQEQPVMTNEATDERIAALEAMVGQLVQALTTPAAAPAPIAEPAPVAEASYLDLIGEPAPAAPLYTRPVPVGLESDLRAQIAQRDADLAACLAAFRSMAAGRRAQGRAHRAEKLRTIRALAAAQEASEVTAEAVRRAETAEAMLATLRPLADALAAMRAPAADYVAPDHSFVNEGRPKGRWPVKDSAKARVREAMAA